MSAFQTGSGFWMVPDDPPRPQPPEVEVPEVEHVLAEPVAVVAPVTAPAAATPSPKVQRGSAPGLTAPGVAVVVLAVSVVGAIIDTTVGNDLGPFFAVLFVAASIYAATQVRRRDLVAAVIAPPLVFLAIIGVHEILSPTGKSRALIDLMGDLLSTLALNAPTLWVGTLVAGGVIFARYRRRH